MIKQRETINPGRIVTHNKYVAYEATVYIREPATGRNKQLKLLVPAFDTLHKFGIRTEPLWFSDFDIYVSRDINSSCLNGIALPSDLEFLELPKGHDLIPILEQIDAKDNFTIDRRFLDGDPTILTEMLTFIAPHAPNDQVRAIAKALSACNTVQIDPGLICRPDNPEGVIDHWMAEDDGKVVFDNLILLEDSSWFKDVILGKHMPDAYLTYDNHFIMDLDIGDIRHAFPSVYINHDTRDMFEKMMVEIGMYGLVRNKTEMSEMLQAILPSTVRLHID